jgi:hypothetical protein
MTLRDALFQCFRVLQPPKISHPHPGANIHVTQAGSASHLPRKLNRFFACFRKFFALKGQCHEIFDFGFFFMNQFTPSP